MNFEDERGNDEPAPRRFPIRTSWAVAIVIVVCGAALAFLIVGRGGGGLLERARVQQQQAPLAALQLLEQAIEDAGGEYPDAQVMKCEILGGLQGWRSAERYYDTIQSPGKSSQKALIELAIAAKHGNAEWLSAKALSAAHHPGPDEERVVRLLLGVKYYFGEKAAVLKLCDELARLAPQDPEPWMVSAGIYHETEQFAPALIAYREALERSPPEREALRMRLQVAEVSLHLGDLETAEKQIRILRNLSPGVPTMDLANAKLLRRKGRDQEAKAIVEEVLAKEPHFPAGLMLRGLLRFDEGDFRAAADDFRGVIAINPFDHQAHYKLGQVYQRLEMTEESEQEFAESRRLTDAVSQILSLGRQLDANPTSRELRLKLAEQHQLLGDAQTAEHWRRTAEDIR